jgi:DNA-binding transcriptional ArsR family regulator
MQIPERQPELDALFAKHFPVQENQPETNGNRRRTGVDLTDDEIIAKAKNAKNSAKFERLFEHGDTSEYDHDDSRADLALLSILAFYSQDHDQLDRLFRLSALCRDKWLRRPDYRRRTIDAAINGLTETYRTSSSSSPYSEDDGDDGNVPLAVKSFRMLPKSDKPREFRVEGLVPERFVTTIYGEGGTGKSIIGLSIALGCARGNESWLGLRLKPSPALYVDWELDEDEQGHRARQLALGLGDVEAPEGLYYLYAAGHATQAVLLAALAACKKHRIGVVVIDSAGLAIAGDSTASQDVIRFFGQLDRFRAEGITVILIDHQAKVGSGESYQHKTAFGSVYKGLLSRSRLQVETKERGPGSLQVVMRHNKANFSGLCQSFKVRITFSEERITLERAELADEELIEERTLNTQDRILLALVNGPSFPEDLAEPTGVVLGTIQNALTALKKRGLVEATGERRSNAWEVRTTDEGKRYVHEYLESRRGPSSPSSTP